MGESLQKLAAMINDEGPVHPNVADCLSLEFDWEYGWGCGFKKGDQWVHCVSSYHSTPEEAVADLLGQMEVK
jgi:hypothetical protein